MSAFAYGMIQGRSAREDKFCRDLCDLIFYSEFLEWARRLLMHPFQMNSQSNKKRHLTPRRIAFIFFAFLSIIPRSAFAENICEKVDWGGTYVANVPGRGKQTVRFIKIDSLTTAYQPISLNGTIVGNALVMPLHVADAECVLAWVDDKNGKTEFQILAEGNRGWKRLRPKT